MREQSLSIREISPARFQIGFYEGPTFTLTGEVSVGDAGTVEVHDHDLENFEARPCTPGFEKSKARTEACLLLAEHAGRLLDRNQ